MIPRMRKRIKRFVYPTTGLVTKILNGHELVIDLDDKWMRNNFLFCDVYEPETTKWIEENVKKYDVVLDIGAHIGYHTKNFSNQGAHVYAFEPDNNAHRLLLMNKSSRVTVYQYVVSNMNGMRMFYVSEGGSAWNSIRPIRNAVPKMVYSVTIDSMNFTHADVVKIDVEGAELQVLQGMRETIERSPSLRIILEWLPKNDGDLEGVLKFLDGWKCKPLDHNLLFWR